MKRTIAQTVMFILLAGSAQSTTLISSGDWFDEENWDAGVPTSGDLAVILNDLTATVNSTGGEAQSIQLNGGLTVDSGGDVSVSGSTVVGYLNSPSGSGVLNIAGGTYSDQGLTVCQNNAAIGTVHISAGTYTASGTVQIGRGRSITQAELILSGGIFNAGANAVVLSYDKTCASRLQISGGQFTGGALGPNLGKAESTISYTVDISGGTFNTASWGLTGVSTGKVNITGSNAIIGVSGSLSFGTNLTFTVAPATNGLSKINVGGDVNLGGAKLVISPPAGAQSFPPSIVLIKAQGTLSGTFGSVTGFGEELSGDLVYVSGPGGEVRIDNLRRPSSTATLYFYSSP